MSGKSGKSAPEITVPPQEIAAAFKRSNLPVDRYAGFEEGYKLGAQLRAEACYVRSEQLPITHVEVAS